MGCSYLFCKWLLELVDLQRCDEGDVIKAVVCRRLLLQLIRQIAAQLHHGCLAAGKCLDWSGEQGWTAQGRLTQTVCSVTKYDSTACSLNWGFFQEHGGDDCACFVRKNKTAQEQYQPHQQKKGIKMYLIPQQMSLTCSVLCRHSSWPRWLLMTFKSLTFLLMCC